MAERVRDACALDEVLFVPAGEPPHKEKDALSAPRHRYLMTLLATVENPHFWVHRVDLDRPGPHYTVDTLGRLAAELGDQAEIHFIMGSDSLADLPTWHEPDLLLSTFRIVVAARPGWDIAGIRSQLGDLYARHADRIQAVDVPAIGISSRMIRERIAAGESVRYLLPSVVERYIQHYGLYRT